MTDKTEMTKDLDQLLAAARDEPLPLDDGLFQRIMADAETVASEAEEAARTRPAQGSWVRRALDGLGGWPALSGLVTATLVGVAVGVSPPSLVSDMAAGFLNGTTDPYLVDPYDGFGFELNEG